MTDSLGACGHPANLPDECAICTPVSCIMLQVIGHQLLVEKAGLH